MDDRPTHYPPLVDVPDWLMAEQPVAKRSTAEVLRLTNQIYENFFETFLEKIAEGNMLSDIVKEDNRGINRGKFLAWIMRDPERKQRYFEAQEIQTEELVEQALKIADAVDNPLEDVQRSQLRVKMRLDLAKARYRDRYGDSKRLEVTKSAELPKDHLQVLASRLVMLQKSPDGVYDGDDNVVDVE